jgi:NitT/TauT family transport system substrate-binding protein
MLKLINPVLITIFLLTLSLVTSCDNKSESPPKTLQKITIATMPASFTGYTLFVAQDKGFFQDAGLDVVLDMSFPHGKATLKALDGKADFSVSSETPFIHAVLNGAEIFTIATTITAHNHLAVVSHKDKGETTETTLRGKTIGVTLGSNGEYFLNLAILTMGITQKDVHLKNLKPNEMLNSLKNGDVDAIATWNPIKQKAVKLLGDQGESLTAGGIYSPFFIVSAKKEYVSTNPETVKKLIRALQKSALFIQNHRDEAREIVSKYFEIEASFLKELDATYIFELSLEQAFISTLEDQAKWAMRNKLTEQSAMPNFLNFIYSDALEAIVPTQVTIIK